MIDDKIVNLLSGVFNGNVFPDIAPQNIPQNDLTPYCVYTIIQQTPINTGCTPDNIRQTSVQIDIYTQTNKIQVVTERNLYFNEVYNILKNNGFSFREVRYSFDNDIRLYRSSSDWYY